MTTSHSDAIEPILELQNVSILKNKNILIGLSSCLVESYTTSLFLFSAPILNSQLFPTLTPFMATIATYLIVAFGLFMYPIGGIVFGKMGDKWGRKKALCYSSLGLAFATGVLGLIPLGSFLAPIFFLICTLLQHFCSGGDYSTSAIFTLEHSNKKHLSILSGIACFASVLGLIAAQTMAANLSNWRMGCLIGFIGALLSCYLRMQGDETPEYTQIVREHAKPKNAESSAKASGLLYYYSLIFIFAGFLCAVYYYIFLFLSHHIVLTEQAAKLNILLLSVYAVALLIGGWIASKIKIIKNIQIFSWLLFAFLGHLFFLEFYVADISSIMLVVHSILIVFVFGLVIGPQHAFYVQAMPPVVRCRGILIPFTMGAAIIGGVTPMICEALNQFFGSMAYATLWPLFWTGVVGLLLFHIHAITLKMEPI